MARCADCVHFSLCDYNTNIAGDSRIKLFYDTGAEKCSFFKPTADVAEVKHGEWVRPTKYSDYMCSICNKSSKGLFGTLSAFCPHCGAKMDGGKQNDL